VVTLLSPSYGASLRAQNALRAVLSLEPQTLASSDYDELDRLFQSWVPGLSFSCKSVASRCAKSGTMFHFLSIEKDSQRRRLAATAPTATSTPTLSSSSQSMEAPLAPFSLLSLTDDRSASTHRTTKGGNEQSQQPNNDTAATIGAIRKTLSEHVSAKSVLRMKMKNIVSGRPIGSAEILADIATDGMPLLDLPHIEDSATDGELAFSEGSLKEIVIPFHDFATYNGGGSDNVLTKMSSSDLPRPCTGVYRWHGSTVCARPLPSASVDHSIAAPSFVFHRNETPGDANNVPTSYDDSNVRVSRIGFGGLGSGQWMLGHRDWYGLDIRLCSKHGVSSAFHEAQESLLAGSIDELQSTNTLLDGQQVANEDDRLNDGDCWVEVRQTLKRPSGFFDKSAFSAAMRLENHGNGRRGGNSPRIAKAPDIPYE